MSDVVLSQTRYCLPNLSVGDFISVLQSLKTNGWTAFVDDDKKICLKNVLVSENVLFDPITAVIYVRCGKILFPRNFGEGISIAQAVFSGSNGELIFRGCVSADVKYMKIRQIILKALSLV